jgi:hypothetical protein
MEDGPLAIPLKLWLELHGVKWSASGIGLTEQEMQFLKSEYELVVCRGDLNSNNPHGYCKIHNHLKRCKAGVWKRCAEPGCTNRTETKTEFCRPHRYPSNRPSQQKYCECGEGPLRVDAKHCHQHQHRNRRPLKKRRTCEYGTARYPAGEKCQHRIGFASKSGLCPIHREVVYRQKVLDDGAKRTAEYRARTARRTLPADLRTKPAIYLKIVPVLIADRAAGGNISNKQVLDMFGLSASTTTMRRIRKYCGVPGTRGAPRKYM